MRIISVQTIAGGTGVTTVAKEIIAEAVAHDERILALDFGHNQMLYKEIGPLGFIPGGDAGYLFWHNAHKFLNSDTHIPSRMLLHLGKPCCVYQYCDERVLLGEGGYRSLSDAGAFLRQRLDWFSHFFDVCVVDMSKAPAHLMRMFVELSDEICFCERYTGNHATWEAFHAAYVKGTNHKPRQVWTRYADRGNQGPIMIPDSPSHG